MTIRITAIDRLGASHHLKAKRDSTLMETLRDHGLPVEAVCGGCCSCATCHVYLDTKWIDLIGPRGKEEHDLVSLSDHFDKSKSRLSCQIRMDERLQGLLAVLAPEE